jgi:hypothetical protein
MGGYKAYLTIVFNIMNCLSDLEWSNGTYRWVRGEKEVSGQVSSQQAKSGVCVSFACLDLYI